MERRADRGGRLLNMPTGNTLQARGRWWPRAFLRLARARATIALFTQTVPEGKAGMANDQDKKAPWGLIAGLFTIGILLAYFIGASIYDALHEEREGKPTQTAAEIPTPPTAPVTAATTPTFADGKAVYERVCQACHQASGQGVPGTFPPLAGSEWVSDDPAVPVKIVLKGLQGPLTVKGQNYGTMAMPPQEGVLNDAEIAAVVTHIRRSFGNQASQVDAAFVANLRAQLAARSNPFTATELK